MTLDTERSGGERLWFLDLWAGSLVETKYGYSDSVDSLLQWLVNAQDFLPVQVAHASPVTRQPDSPPNDVPRPAAGRDFQSSGTYDQPVLPLA